MRVHTREYPIPGRPSAGLLERPGYDVRHQSACSYRLTLWGPLSETWTAALGVGLAEAGIRVVRGLARRVESVAWLGEFELEALDDSDEPVLLDYLALTRAPLDELASPLISIAGHHSSLTAKYGGSLYLEVRARDRLGFLGGLLAPIAQLGLAPEELEIDTLGAPVLDRFFLKQRSGASPSAEQRRALCGLLETLSKP
jgi:hypothetical protein